MRSRNTESRQLGAWLFAGLSAPLAQFTGGMCWQTVAVVALTCLIGCWLLGRIACTPGKWMSLLEGAWLAVVLAVIGRWVSGSWPSGNVFPAVPLTLLALGAGSACRGTGPAARAGSTVFWQVALVYSGVVAAGVGQVEMGERAAFDTKLDLRLVVSLLIPALAVFLPGDWGKLPVRAVAGIWGFAVLLSVLVTGALSLQVAMDSDMPLYEWVKGLTLAGTLQRFEALVSVALTMGWFALASFVLCVAGQLADNVKGGSYGKGVWGVAVVAGLIMVSNVQINPALMVAGCVVLWGVVPAMMAVFCGNKKLKKSENNA